ncbi:transcription antitermination factor NusB [Vagococcus vulneris]|uniref:Transcription antitermination protein NusB n=1 Tax=Vagococcus vulneris TaxID=1977869 RepID=A0A429ZWB1_9ENTE|nr:transcription antitermination factor NusB [Vagococcus vulneris]RST98053.1 hypothetical protein CBF37_09115 [Vagococcus vulneris]
MRKYKLDLTRHQLRQLAFQSIFIQLFDEDLTAEDAVDHALALFPRQFNDGAEIPEYLTIVVPGITEKETEIDAVIVKYLKNWKINRIAKTDLAILRLAIYEMLYLEDVPTKVSLNEALELTKEFSDDESRRFVNGVLSAAMLEINENK